jgi:hypothetical protein
MSFLVLTGINGAIRLRTLPLVEQNFAPMTHVSTALQHDGRGHPFSQAHIGAQPRESLFRNLSFCESAAVCLGPSVVRQSRWLGRRGGVTPPIQWHVSGSYPQLWGRWWLDRSQMV